MIIYRNVLWREVVQSDLKEKRRQSDSKKRFKRTCKSTC